MKYIIHTTKRYSNTHAVGHYYITPELGITTLWTNMKVFTKIILERFVLQEYSKLHSELDDLSRERSYVDKIHTPGIIIAQALEMLLPLYIQYDDEKHLLQKCREALHGTH